MLKMTLYCYFQLILPSPSGELAGTNSPEAITSASKAVVTKAQSETKKTAGGQYDKISAEKQAAIAKYTLENGSKAAAQYFSQQKTWGVVSTCGRTKMNTKKISAKVVCRLERKLAPMIISHYTLY